MDSEPNNEKSSGRTCSYSIHVLTQYKSFLDRNLLDTRKTSPRAVNKTDVRM